MTFEDTYEECSEITLGDTVYVTDPCYTPDTWCCNKVEGVKPGHYQTAITKNNEDRVACIGIYHEAANDDTVWEKAPFEVGVDSGQAGVFDAEYFAYTQVHVTGAFPLPYLSHSCIKFTA